MIRRLPAPSERAASMYSRSLMDSTCPRTMRPTDGPAEEPDDQHDDHVRLGPMIETSAMAASRNGNGEHEVDEPGQHRVDHAAEEARRPGRWRRR